jgi:hypothetical protein
MLSALIWQLDIGVSEQLLAPVFKRQSVHEDCLTLADGTAMYFREVSNQLPAYAV